MSSGRFLLFLLTLLIFLLGVFAFVIEAPPIWVPIALGIVYLGSLIVGALNMPLQMFGPAICFVSDAKNEVALTFDDGPDPISTPLVLKLLREAGAKASFFVIGRKAAEFPHIVRAIVEEGHTLGIHSYAHQRLYALLPPLEVKRDIERCRDAVEQVSGVRPIWFRPPIGQMSPRTAKGIALAGAEAIGFSVRARDGAKSATMGACLRRVISGLRPGAIVLLHDAWERREPDGPEWEGDSKNDLAHAPVGVRILEELLVETQRRGLKCVTLERLILAAD